MITFHIDWILVLTFIVGTAVPVLVGIVTTKVTSPVRKALALIGLSFVGSILTELLNALVTSTPWDAGDALFKWGTIAVVAVASYFGFWSRPTTTGGVSVATKLQSIGRVAE